MLNFHQMSVTSKRQPPALSRETNTDVTKTAVHRLATRGGLKKGVDPIEPPHVKMPNLQQIKVCLQSGTKSGFGLYP